MYTTQKEIQNFLIIYKKDIFTKYGSYQQSVHCQHALKHLLLHIILQLLTFQDNL